MIEINLIDGQAVCLDCNFTLSDLVKATRTVMGLNQREFASLLGLSGQSLISRAERGVILLNNIAFINLLKLYDYNGFCVVVEHFAKPISTFNSYPLIPEPSELWFVEALIGELCFDLGISRLKVAELLSIEYHTFLNMSKGYKTAGNYQDICTIMWCFIHSTGVYRFLQTY